MITSVDVCNAIAEVVAKLWPARIVYRDFCSVDHQRPSSYLYVVKSEISPANFCLSQWTMEAELELFCSTDEYDVSSTEALRADQEAVLLAFALPSLQVEDGWVTLNAVGDGMETGSAYVKFTASWFTETPGYEAPEDSAPMMEDFEVNGSVIAGGPAGR